MTPDRPTPESLQIDEFPVARQTLRLAVVTETWPPEVNGVATTLARLVHGLHERQHSVQLIRPRQPQADAQPGTPAYDQVLMRSLPLPRYPGLRMGVPSRRTLRRLWTAQRPDLVHIATEGPLGWSALQAALRLKLPVTSDFRTNFHAYARHYGAAWLHKPMQAYLRHFHNRTLCTMVPTDAMRRTLADEGYANLRVVGRGVDLERFSPAHRSEALRQSWGAGPHAPVAIHVGRLAPEKNLDALLAGWAAIREVRPDATLVLVGDGPARAEMQARCPQAVFAGMRTGHDLAQHYASADLCLFPSQTETFGNITPEAMASGLALIAFDLAAASTMVRHGDTGWLVEPGRTDAFAQAAASLARELPLARRLGQRAAEAATQFGWGPVVGQVESLFTALAAAAPAPRARRDAQPAGAVA